MKAGRPSQYRKTYCKQVEKLCKLGLIDREIADVFDISERTFNTWKKQHPEFLQSIKKGKAIADAEVVDSLYKRAIGFEHPDSQIFYDSKTGNVIVEKTIKHYAPDTTAVIFWLKNRRPGAWRDKQEIVHDIPNAIKFTLDID